ncbi:hypothetical protein QYM36_004772 [Artemia franciscana]|uniref:Phospholipid/glycerol acyltransferase domain-containing protein n=1 Tax=Artemia franciscana TaxID=6661 RepID=A0AA88I3D0_ARTSF|nr:hypothetical protein QYM36_004772 [Artemia franciscana]
MKHSGMEEIIVVPDSYDVIHPFYNRIFLSVLDKIRIALFTILVLPIRLIGVAICVAVCWILSVAGTYGVTEKEIRDYPLEGKRRLVGKYLSFFGRLGFWFFGVRVQVKGEQATRQEAPVLVVAPHSSFTDLVIGMWMGLPHLVCRAEESRSLLVGSIMKYSQPVYVVRDDANSRQNTLKEMIRRATSSADWRQVMVFPEGTCTNRKAVITFKPGAFYPGVPVQPVCLRYAGSEDTISWTWDGPGVLKILWLTLTKTITTMTIEFLPSVVPSEKEKLDPNLFAENVQLLMARHLGVPVADYSFDDAQLVAKSKELGLPSCVGLLNARSVKIENGINQKMLKGELLEKFASIADKELGTITLMSLSCYLGIEEESKSLIKLLNFFDKDFSGYVNFKNYILGYLDIIRNCMSEENLPVLYVIIKQYNATTLLTKELDVNLLSYGELL